jgi:hypothetical protein
LDAAGNLLDPLPFVISEASGDQVMPRAVWNGSNWLVVWQSQEVSGSYWATEVMATRVSAQGAVLDPTPIRVTPYQYSQLLQFSAASDGANWLVVAEGSSVGEGAVLGFRISSTGTVLDPNGIVILPETYYQRYGLAIGFARDEYLFLWTEWNSTGLDDVFGFRLTTALQKLDASPIVVAASTDYDVQPRMATDGTNFFVAYERYNTCCGTGGRVFGTRVNHQGLVQDKAGLDVSGDVGITVGRHACAAWDGGNWTIAWTGPGISVAQVSPSGTVLKRGGVSIDLLLTAPKEEPDIAAIPGIGSRVVWTDYRAGSYYPKDIFSAGVSSKGQPSAGVSISLGAPSQLAPRLAASGNQYLAVFLSAVSSGQRVLAQRMDASGNPLDSAPVELASLSPNFYNPSVAGNGSLFLVVWEDRSSSTIYGKRVQPNGVVLDATPLLIMRGNTPDVAAIGDTFLVVDSHAPINPENRYIFARRIRGSDGALVDASPVAIGDNFSIIPRVTALNGRWLTVWEGHPTHDDTTANIYGAFVDTSGNASPQLAITQDGYYVRFHNRPVLSASATNALVMWSDPRFGNSDWGIFARRVLLDGTVLDAAGPPPSPNPPVLMPASYPGFAVTTAPNNQDKPAVAWNGNEYVAMWEDQRANTFFVDQRTDIFGARIAGNSTVLDPDGFAIANAAVPETSPALAGMNGTATLAAAVFKDQSPYTSYRIGIRTLAGQPVIAPMLRISRIGSNITLSWPTNSPGFVLESASTPIAAGGWGSVGQSPIVNGTNYTVTLPISAATRHFRLHRP